MQGHIDRGIKCCLGCQEFGFNVFCGDCGDRFAGPDLEWRECAKCHADVSTDFCSLCGYSVADEYLRRWERGDVDFVQEQADAEEIMQRFYRARPDQAPPGMVTEAPRGGSPMQTAVLEVFGPGR